MVQIAAAGAEAMAIGTENINSYTRFPFNLLFANKAKIKPMTTDGMETNNTN